MDPVEVFLVYTSCGTYSMGILPIHVSRHYCFQSMPFLCVIFSALEEEHRMVVELYSKQGVHQENYARKKYFKPIFRPWLFKECFSVCSTRLQYPIQSSL